LPSDFWRYSKGSFDILINKLSGFELLACEEGNPGRIFSLTNDPTTNTIFLAKINQSIAIIAKKVDEVDPSLSWSLPPSVFEESRYPKNNINPQ
jgi:hypothetical protein